MTCNNPKLDHVNINAHTKFGYIQKKSSQDIEWKRNYERQMDERTDGQTDGWNDRQPKSNTAPTFSKLGYKYK